MLACILRLLVCLAVAVNVMFSVPSLAFAHVQMTRSQPAQDAATGHEQHGAVHQHQHQHDGAIAAQADADCCQAPADQPVQKAPCHCDMGLCSPVMANIVQFGHPYWASSRVAVLPPPDDAVQLSDLLPPLRPPRA